MESDEVFEAISHPLRIKILRLLAERPRGFSELKKELGVKSSGKLDFHIKKLEGLIALNDGDKYALTKEGYAALQAIDTIRRYGWQRRAYILNTVVYAVAMTYMLWKAWTAWGTGNFMYIVIALVLVTLWYAWYSYWSIVKRRVFKAY